MQGSETLTPYGKLTQPALTVQNQPTIPKVTRPRVNLPGNSDVNGWTRQKTPRVQSRMKQVLKATRTPSLDGFDSTNLTNHKA